MSDSKCYVWYWIDENQVPHRVLAEDPFLRPADVPEKAEYSEQDADVFREELLIKLEELDKKSIRALREGNEVRLMMLEQQAEKLRSMLRKLL